MACASSSLIADWDAAGAAKMVNKLAAVVDAVEVDRLAIVISPRTVRRRSQSGHLSKRRPAIDVRPPTTNPRLPLPGEQPVRERDVELNHKEDNCLRSSDQNSSRP